MNIVVPKIGRGKPIYKQKIFGDVLYSNNYLIGKTGSGKTILLYNFLRNLDKRSNVFIFSSTVEIDPVYKEIQEMLTNKGVVNLSFTSLVNEDGNVLEGFLNSFSDQPREEDEIVEKKEPQICCFNSSDASGPDKSRRKKKKKIYPNDTAENILIFDDLNKGITRNEQFVNLLKKSRHYKCRTYIMSQMLRGITPDSFEQLHYCYIFGGLSLKDLKTLYERVNLSINFERFLKIYKELTLEPHSWMRIDCRKGYIINSKFKIVKT
jgi:hypothetical protein